MEDSAAEPLPTHDISCLIQRQNTITYIDQVPSPHLSVFVTTHDTRFFLPKTGATPIGRVCMPRKRIQELPRRRVEQPHVRVEGGNQERRAVCRWDDRGNRLCGREGKCERAKRGRGGHRTSNEICAEFALAEVVRADVAVHGTSDDGRRVDVEGLHGIAGILEHLDRRAGLGSRRGEERRGGRGGDVPYVPQPDRRIVRTCPLESARRPSLHVRS